MELGKSFFTLKGLSGILIGLYGLATVYLIDKLTSGGDSGIEMVSQLPLLFLQIAVTVITLIFILISLFTLWTRARRKAKNADKKLWNTSNKKIRLHSLFTLLVLIVVIIFIANEGYYSLVTPISLFFYGLFLLNLSRISSKRLAFLSIGEILLAVAAYLIYDKEMIFLALGFGLLHIIYGAATFLRPTDA
ncbi:MAG: hypothetical protein KJO83_00055 [Bacteroidia bacterium]|nr:hypothetical protein [Bacteroidia bacterium]